MSDREPRSEDGDRPDPEDLCADQAQLIEQLDDSVALVLFQTAESRRSAVDQMMWQAPALSLTAQAFLMTIAYGGGSRWDVRLATAALGLITAGATVQLLVKHRSGEETHSRWLERFAEARQGWPAMHNPNAEEAFAWYGREDQGKVKNSRLRSRLSGYSSFEVWTWMLAMFGVVTSSFSVAGLITCLRWLTRLDDAAPRPSLRRCPTPRTDRMRRCTSVPHGGRCYRSRLDPSLGR
jgi:hypothetical protein